MNIFDISTTAFTTLSAIKVHSVVFFLHTGQENTFQSTVLANANKWVQTVDFDSLHLLQQALRLKSKPNVWFQRISKQNCILLLLKMKILLFFSYWREDKFCHFFSKQKLIGWLIIILEKQRMLGSHSKKHMTELTEKFAVHWRNMSDKDETIHVLH